MAGEKKKYFHGGHRQRLKDLALATRLQGLSDFQVLELLLYYGLPQCDTNTIAHELMNHFGSFSAVLDADYESLLTVDGVGPNSAILISLLPALFSHYQRDSLKEKHYLPEHEKIIKYAISYFIGKPHEELYMICLNSQQKMTNMSLLNKGSISSVHVYPRTVVEVALRHKARFVILTHNHPSGKMQLSAADLELTKQISSALAAISIYVLDHIIVSGEDYLSFKEKGLIPRFIGLPKDRS